MPYRLTSAQRWVLADCVRTSLVGWLITCPVAGQRCRILQARATSLLGFGFSRFTTMAANHFGSDYRPCHLPAEAAVSSDSKTGAGARSRKRASTGG